MKWPMPAIVDCRIGKEATEEQDELGDGDEDAIEGQLCRHDEEYFSDERPQLLCGGCEWMTTTTSLGGESRTCSSAVNAV